MKPYQPDHKIVENLMRLKEDLNQRALGQGISATEAHIALMINQCLFKTYERGTYKP